MKTGCSLKKMVQENQARSCTQGPAWNILDRESCGVRSTDTARPVVHFQASNRHKTGDTHVLVSCLFNIMCISFRGNHECNKHSLANTPKTQKSPKKQAKVSLSQSFKENLLTFHGPWLVDFGWHTCSCLSDFLLGGWRGVQDRVSLCIMEPILEFAL